MQHKIMHISNTFQKKIVDTVMCTLYITNMIDVPIEYQNAVDQIIDLTARTEYMYGCKREGWLTFTVLQRKARALQPLDG